MEQWKFPSNIYGKSEVPKIVAPTIQAFEYFTSDKRKAVYHVTVFQTY